MNAGNYKHFSPLLLAKKNKMGQYFLGNLCIKG